MPDIVVTKTREEPGATSLRVEVAPERVRAAEEKATARYAKRVRLPGFRKGKAPHSVVRRRFYDAIREEVIRELIGESWKVALEQEKLKPIADPRVRNLQFEENAPVTFELLVEVKPELELSRLGGFKLVRKVPRVTDEMVNAQIEDLRRRRAPWVPLNTEPGPGDLVQVTLATLEGEEEKDVRRYELVLGEGRALPEIEERIQRMKPGETGETEVRLPDDFPDPERRGQLRRVRIVLHEAKRQELPPLDDAFAREIGDFDSLEELRRAVREDLEKEAAREADAELRRQLMEQLVAANGVVAPRPLVDRLLASYAQVYEIPDSELERFATEFRPIAEAQVKRDLVIDHVAEKFGLRATAEDVDQRIAAIARRRNAEPGQVYASLEKAGRLRELERSITEEKVYAYLLEQSTVTED
ncbi:MAG: trigger factor [Gemmatimonadales bacterium]|nr:MAG: trigger factor [Gemmatimonadales bacterium]